MQMNFDPITGQPINQNNNNVNNGIAQPEFVEPTPIVKPIEQQTITNNTINTQQQMQNIPTVEQSKQMFISNTQENNVVKNDEKKEGPNIAFIIILFIIIFAAIFFLFPYLLDVL